MLNRTPRMIAATGPLLPNPPRLTVFAFLEIA